MANYSKFLSLITGADRTVDLSLAANVLELGSGGLQFDSTTSGQHLVISGSAITSGYSLFWPVAQAASSGLVLTNDGTGHLSWTSPSSGSVTSVAFADASTTPIYSISGSPVTSSGTLTQTLATQTANTVFAGPSSGAAAQPTFRSLVVNDIPSLSSLYLPLIGGTMTGNIVMGGHNISGVGSLIDNAGAGLTIQGGGSVGPQGVGSIVFDSSSNLTIRATTLSFNGLGGDTFELVNSILNMNSNKITNVASGTVATDGVNYGQVILANGSNPFTANQALGGFLITGSGNPVNPGDLVSKSYVDGFINGTSWKTAVLVATTANITLSGEQVIDGVTTSASRVLVKNQTTPASNGIYVSNAAAWTRSADFNVWADVPAAAVFVESGTVNADLGFVCTSQPGGILGTTAINFVQFSASGAYSADGTTLQLVSGVFSVKTSGIALSNMANLPANTIIGNNTVSSATPLALSTAQVTAMLNVFSSSLQGVVPASGGGTTNFLRADGTWAVAGTGTVTSIAVAVPTSSIFGVTGSPVTTSGTISITTTGTSGGIPYFSATGTLSSSGLLAANQIVLGGGAGAAPTSLAAGTANTVLHGNAAGAPTFSAVVVADMNSGAATPGQVLTATGSGGQAYQAPVNHLIPNFIAGQAFTANTTYVVRLGKNSNSETTGSVYSADITASTADNFWAIGFALSTTAVAIGGSIPVAIGGVYILGSADTAFSVAAVGQPVYLGANGTFTTTPPSTSGMACFRLGTVYNTITILVDKQLIAIA